MPGIPRRVIALALALSLFGTTTSALAASGSDLYRTADQAAGFLNHDLHQWAGIDLRKFESKTAYCVSAGIRLARLRRFT